MFVLVPMVICNLNYSQNLYSTHISDSNDESHLVSVQSMAVTDEMLNENFTGHKRVRNSTLVLRNANKTHFLCQNVQTRCAFRFIKFKTCTFITAKCELIV